MPGMLPAMGGLDDMDHYPRIAPLPDGRPLITGDGSGGGNVNSMHTYLMKVGPRTKSGESPTISFQLGPERSGYRKTFGTAFLEPVGIPGSYFLIGGLAGSGDINFGPANPPPDYRINVVGSAERYLPPTAKAPIGKWLTYLQFLGDRPTDRRIMHVGVLLPTKQVLLMGGGTYGTSSPVYYPFLLTPDAKACGGYTVQAMNPGQQPRLYHTSALLLPDGRVFLASGNATRAARDATTGAVRLDTVRLPDGTYTFAQPGSDVISSEIYQIEIFYPPYLFTTGPRPSITKRTRDHVLWSEGSDPSGRCDAGGVRRAHQTGVHDPCVGHGPTPGGTHVHPVGPKRRGLRRVDRAGQPKLVPPGLLHALLRKRQGQAVKGGHGAPRLTRHSLGGPWCRVSRPAATTPTWKGTWGDGRIWQGVEHVCLGIEPVLRPVCHGHRPR